MYEPKYPKINFIIVALMNALILYLLYDFLF